MADTSSLIVPINVAALCVGQPDTQQASGLAPMADFSQLPYAAAGVVHNRGPYISANVVSNAQAMQGAVPLVQGIHLHWALPDGLTAGVAGDSGLAFPAVPNRWLLTRIVVSAPAGQTPSVSVKSWVIESDRLNATTTAISGVYQPTVPQAPSPGQNFMYIGQAFDLETWTEVGSTVPRLSPLTAVGYGEPTFAAFYPNSSTVFGYQDTFSDLPDFDPSTSTVSYHVAGWYSDATQDPLAQAGASPADYGWSVAGTSAPTQTLCSGVVDGIVWNPTTQYLSQSPQPLTVGIGPSTQEALSALLASVLEAVDPTEYANAEQVLNALQFGLLSGTNQVDSLAQFEETVHAAGFASLSSGPLWTVVQSSGANGAAGGEVTLPDSLAESLNALNVTQLQLNDAQAQLEAMQFQLFVDWYKYLLVEYDSSDVPTRLQAQASAVQTYVQSEIDAINALQAQITGSGGLQAQVTTQSQTLAASLDSSLQLTNSIGAPRYYQPSDPVLVLSGNDVTPTQRYGNDGANSPDGTLACRLDSQVVTSATLAAGIVTGSAETQIANTALPALAAQPANAPAALLGALMQEAFFLANSLQPGLAAALWAQGGAQNPAALDLSGTITALQTAAAAFIGATTPPNVTYTGTAPDPSWLDAWTETPWLPLLLQYQVAFQPVNVFDPTSGTGSYAANFINGQFAFDADSIELQYTGPAPSQLQSYSGSVVLTPNATAGIQTQIQNFLNNTGNSDPELSDILNAVSGLPLLSQGLGGSIEAMRMRGLTLQMPVADPLASPPGQQFASTVANAVAGQNAVAPLPENSFNPIRTGVFSIQSLRLVDVFGRFKDYRSPTTIVAQGLAPPSGLALPAGQAFLPPRITQPSRLLFRWLAADDDNVEANSSPATSPVLGWVVPNYLDNSLILYNASGTALGELALSADQTSVLWTAAPGGSFALGTPIATVFANENAYLAAFAEGIYNGGDATFFAPFFAAIRDAMAFSLPAQFRESAGTAVLLGQPLVLARANLTLDLAGPAATDESWTSFTNTVLNSAPPNDAGFSGVQFPVTLGALTQLDDTLVGYWIENGGRTNFQTFYAIAATQSQGGVQPPGQSTLTLTPQAANSGGQVTVTLLFDPRGSVHASTGILPVKAIDIPPSQYAAALASLGVTFQVSPVLSGSNVPASQPGSAPPMSLMQPKVTSGSWAWVTVSGGNWTSTTLVDTPTSQATLDYSPQQISEGWLSLTGVEPTS